MIIQFTNIVEFVALERAYGYNYHINMNSVHVGTFIFPLFLVMSLCLMNEMCSEMIWFEKLCLYFVCQHILVKFRLHEILKKNKVKLLPKIWKRLKFLLHFINAQKGVVNCYWKPWILDTGLYFMPKMWWALLWYVWP